MSDLSAREPGPAAQRAAALRRRIASALVLAPVAIIVTMMGGWPFAIMAMMAGLAIVYEWGQVIDGRGVTINSALHALVVVVVAVVAQLGHPGLGLWAIAFGTLATVALAKERHQAARWPLLGTPYVGLPVLSLLWLRMGADGDRHLVWLLGVVWSMDTAAYFVGRTIGGPKLAPGISPNKTWSGLIGGVVASGLWGLMVSVMTNRPGAMVTIGVLSAALGAWAQVGDLAESALKRRFGRKDSGNLIPGHGGMMDRLDGLLFAAPVAALWLVVQGEGALP